MLVSEASFTSPRDDCPEPERWHSPDEHATEDEVSQFLAGLCVLLRPHRVLETGTYHGDSAEAMGRALVGYGELDTLEVDVDRVHAARNRLAGLPVNVRLTRSLDWPQFPYDLAFFDSDPTVRFDEIRRFARSGAVWVLHDARWLDMQQQLRGLQIDGVIDCWMNFPTPRGLAMGRWP